MALTTLAGTKWYLKDVLNLTTTRLWNISYTREGYNEYNQLGFNTDGWETQPQSLVLCDIDGESEILYSNGEWYTGRPIGIYINGGSDATNSTLIAWFQANATQLTMGDLTGTSWELMPTLSLSEFTYNINFMSNSMDFTEIARWESSRGAEINNYLGYNDEYAYINGVWENEAYRTIHIHDGDDVRNPQFIAWLEYNATLLGLSPNSTWQFNSTLSKPSEYWVQVLHFTSGSGQSYTNMEAEFNSGDNFTLIYAYPYGIEVVKDVAYRSETQQWTDNAYKVLTVTELTYFPDPVFIEWIQNNARLMTKQQLFIYCKANGIWKEGTPYIKANNNWAEASQLFIKQNNTWTEI